MPPKSKSQRRLAHGVKSGSIKRSGMSKAAARKVLEGDSSGRRIPEKKRSGKR